MSTRPPTRAHAARTRGRRLSRRLAPGLLAAAVAPVLATPAPASAAPAPAAVVADGYGKGGWWWDAMGVDDLHRRGTGKGITVAVVDTPVNPDVPELKGRIASSTSPCLDAKGSGTLSPRSTGREAEHGTTMAALIGGTGRGSGASGTGIRGIAPDVTLRHYAVSYPNPDRADDLLCSITGPGYDDVAKGVIASIRAAVADGADIINLSVVTDYDLGYADALLEAYRAGAVVVAGTDNAGRGVMWPALGNGVVVVNPVDRTGRVYDQSVTDAPQIGFTAPGKAVNALGVEGGRWGRDYLADGSSNATALVSGGLAAMWSAHPEATGNQVLQAAKAAVGLRAKGSAVETWFRREGTNLPQVTSRNPAYGWGIFDPADAVALDPTTFPDTNPMALDQGGAEPSFADVTAATAAAPPASASPSPSPSPTVSVAPNGATPADDGADGSGPSGALLGVLAAVVLAAVAGALVVLARRRSTPTTPGPSPDDPVTTSAGRPGAGPRTHGEENA